MTRAWFWRTFSILALALCSHSRRAQAQTNACPSYETLEALGAEFEKLPVGQETSLCQCFSIFFNSSDRGEQAKARHWGGLCYEENNGNFEKAWELYTDAWRIANSYIETLKSTKAATPQHENYITELETKLGNTAKRISIHPDYVSININLPATRQERRTRSFEVRLNNKEVPIHAVSTEFDDSLSIKFPVRKTQDKATLSVTGKNGCKWTSQIQMEKDAETVQVPRFTCAQFRVDVVMSSSLSVQWGGRELKGEELQLPVMSTSTKEISEAFVLTNGKPYHHIKKMSVGFAETGVYILPPPPPPAPPLLPLLPLLPLPSPPWYCQPRNISLMIGSGSLLTSVVLTAFSIGTRVVSNSLGHCDSATNYCDQFGVNQRNQAFMFAESANIAFVLSVAPLAHWGSCYFSGSKSAWCLGANPTTGGKKHGR